MRALHRATLSLYSDLSLDGVLQRITQAARDLANARYAALGVPDDSGGLAAFITVGISDDEIRRIDHPPSGRGLLGEMLRTGQTIRMANLGDHPKAGGFPPGHPIMRSFLGVPIAAYGRPLGQIYLTDKLGADEFDAQDQRLIEMLAAHAAAAIENARLYRQVLSSEAELTQSNEQLELFNSLVTAVSSAMELESLLEEMLDRVIGLFGAEAGEIFLREETDNSFHLAVHRGRAQTHFWNASRYLPGEGFNGRVVDTGRLAWTKDLLGQPSFNNAEGFGALVAVPLVVRTMVVGVLDLAFRGERTINDHEAGLLEAMGAGVGAAVENARLYRQARRLAVLEERERIGMDLHDGIIQSIYAVGLTLEYTRILMRESPDKGAARLEQAIDGLNEIIRDIRSYILDLQPSRISTDNLVEAMSRLVREFRANTLVEADLQLEARALSDLNREARAAYFLIAQEALANIAKHAHASKVLVSLRRLGENVALQVFDNGDGFEADHNTATLGHGLSNMAERARQIGGNLTLVSSPGEGTTVTVETPALNELATVDPTHDLSASAHTPA